MARVLGEAQKPAQRLLGGLSRSGLRCGGCRMSVAGDGAGDESDDVGEERADGVNNLAKNFKHGDYLSVEVAVRRGAGVAPLRSQ